jgi:hypothetical protein
MSRLLHVCVDCGVDTFVIGERYMVQDALWTKAWEGCHRPKREILCIGCLEQRLGRRLVASDFQDAPINDLADPTISPRMRDRLSRECC